MRLAEFKKAFFASKDWRRQRGPEDDDGYNEDAVIGAGVRTARSWKMLEERCPSPWREAACNRCLPSQL